MHLTNRKERLGTTERSFEIIEELKKSDGARITELAERLDITKSSVYYHIDTLRQLGYVTVEGDSYYLGLPFANLGNYVQYRKRGYSVAREVREELEEELDLDVDFLVEENGKGVYVVTVSANESSQLSPQVGEKNHLHAIASGKAILAEYPQSYVNEIIDRWGLPAETANTITDRDELFFELEKIRERGYSTNFGEYTEGIMAIGVAVKNPDGSVLGSLSINGPSYKVDNDWLKKEASQLLINKADKFEEELSISNY